MNNDLISREALKFELRQHLAYHKEKAKLTTLNADKMSHSLVATGIQLAIDSIDNVPTVSIKSCRECPFSILISKALPLKYGQSRITKNRRKRP